MKILAGIVDKWGKIILVVVTSLSIAVFGWYWRWRQIRRATLSGYLLTLPDYTMVTGNFGGESRQFELVHSSAAVQQGLSDRSEIGSDGMLFVMPARGFYPFWMPRMQFDLDIVWLDEGRVVDISYEVKAQPNVPTTQLPLYTSKTPANMVLEIASGQAQAWHLQVGDELEIAR